VNSGSVKPFATTTTPFFQLPCRLQFRSKTNRLTLNDQLALEIRLNICHPTLPEMSLPTLPVPHSQFIPYLAKQDIIKDALEPYKTYESKLREIFAQEPANAIIDDPHVNVLPLFGGHEGSLKIRGGDMTEPSQEKDKYLLTLPDAERKPSGSPAIVSSMKEFNNNFNLFSESSLVDLDWSNVVAAGSSVVTSLLPVKVSYAQRTIQVCCIRVP
jgi:hypothetical protein